MPSGTWLSKIGKGTGWTRGPVTRTCADTPDQYGNWYICHVAIDGMANFEDRDGPVFLVSNSKTCRSFTLPES